MEGLDEEREKSNFVRKNSGKTFKSRKHDKSEKRKQRKAWIKRKQEKALRPNDEETKAPKRKNEPKAKLHPPNCGRSSGALQLSRGKMLVELARKHKPQEQPLRIEESQPKRFKKNTETKMSGTCSATQEKKQRFKELDRALLAVQKDSPVGTGTFGSCYIASYRNDFRVVVKEMNLKNSSKKETERAQQEVVHEATVLANLGDHPAIPHLFGVCSDRPPFYLVLQHHSVEGHSVTLSDAVARGIVASTHACVDILKKTCEVILYVHQKGYLHNDLKGNNVVLDGTNHNPVLIDFGKSKRTASAKLLKPKLNIKSATRKYPHIAPELHRGDKQTEASDTYSFGVLVSRVLEVGKFDIPTLNKIVKKCCSSNPQKRPKLREVLLDLEGLQLEGSQ